MTYTVGTLFSGIGVPDLCAELLGMRSVWAVEKEPYCQRVLSAHFPYLDVRGDIFDQRDLPYVDLVVAGFPCQPFSQAGLQRGEKDERYLVPEMLRIIQEVKPRVILLENVPGFASLDAGNTFKQLLRSLAEMGFDAEWCHLRASDFGAPHRRERWFLVGYTRQQRPAVGTQTADQHLPHGQRQHSPTELQWNDQQLGIKSSGAMGYTKSAKRERARNTRRRGYGLANQRTYVGNASTAGFHAAVRQNGTQVQHASRHGFSQRRSSLGDSHRAGWREQRWRKPVRAKFTAAQRASGWGTESRLGRVVDGAAAGVDRYNFKPFPALPGESQYDFEPPRLAPKDTPNRRKRVAAIGNSMVVPVIYAVMQSVLAWLEAQDEAVNDA